MEFRVSFATNVSSWGVKPQFGAINHGAMVPKLMSYYQQAISAKAKHVGVKMQWVWTGIPATTTDKYRGQGQGTLFRESIREWTSEVDFLRGATPISFQQVPLP